MYKLYRCGSDWNDWVKEFEEVDGIVTGILGNGEIFVMSKKQFDRKYYQNRPIYEEEK